MRTRTRFIVTASILLGFLAISLPAQEAADLKQQLFLFNQALGGNLRLGVLCSIATHSQETQSIMLSSRAYKFEATFFDVKSIMDLEKGFNALMNNNKINAILVLQDPVVSSKAGISYLVQRCDKNKLFLLSLLPEAVGSGALMSVIKGAEGPQILVSRSRATGLGLNFSDDISKKIKFLD